MVKILFIDEIRCKTLQEHFEDTILVLVNSMVKVGGPDIAHYVYDYVHCLGWMQERPAWERPAWEPIAKPLITPSVERYMPLHRRVTDLGAYVKWYPKSPYHEILKKEYTKDMAELEKIEKQIMNEMKRNLARMPQLGYECYRKIVETYCCAGHLTLLMPRIIILELLEDVKDAIQMFITGELPERGLKYYLRKIRWTITGKVKKLDVIVKYNEDIIIKTAHG